MPRPRHHFGSPQAAEARVRTAPLVSRWIERLLAAHDPPFTVAQYLTLQAVARSRRTRAAARTSAGVTQRHTAAAPSAPTAARARAQAPQAPIVDRFHGSRPLVDPDRRGSGVLGLLLDECPELLHG